MRGTVFAGRQYRHPMWGPWCTMLLSAFSIAGPESGASDAARSAVQSFLIAARDKVCIAHWPDPASAMLPFEISEIRLGNAAGRELLVRAQGGCFCSPTGNCPFWILVPNGKTFTVLLKTERVESVEALQSGTLGYPDIALSAHDSAFESTHVTYRFDGRRYRRVDCREWSYRDEQDFSRMLQHPRITKCDPDETLP